MIVTVALAVLVVAAPSSSEGADKATQTAQQTKAKQPGDRKAAPSYGDGDLDRVAGRKPWSELTQEERKARRVQGAAVPTPTPSAAPVGQAEVQGPRKNESGGSAEPSAPDASAGVDDAPEPSRQVRASPQVAAAQTQVARLEAAVKSLDAESRQLLERRLLSTDSSEILRLQAEQGVVQERLEAARQELAQASRDLAAAR